MEEDEEEENEEDAVATPTDFFDHEPSKIERAEMRKASKLPSEWLRLLCKQWADENEVLVDSTDAKFLDYKPYLKGMLSSQLLCRLSIPSVSKDIGLDGGRQIDFWRILGVEDGFDKAFIIAQIERFCSLYNIRNLLLDEEPFFSGEYAETDANLLSVAPGGGMAALPPYIDHGGSSVAAAATSVTKDHDEALDLELRYRMRDRKRIIQGQKEQKAREKEMQTVQKAIGKATKGEERAREREIPFLHKAASTCVKVDDSAHEREIQALRKAASKATKGEQKAREREAQALRALQERIEIDAAKGEVKAREKDAIALRKAQERNAREATREERRRKKIEIREQREKHAKEQKAAALRRAAELVASNRVPVEITRGAAAAKAAVAALPIASPPSAVELEYPDSRKKLRSAIVVSTAADLHAICTHAKNLWAKYNAIAKEHNQKVNWITVAKELGIHVKVREKYSRMHARAEARGFDWVKCADWKIKDHPEVFLEPTSQERKSKMPRSVAVDASSDTTVLVHESKEDTDDVAAAVAAAVVVPPTEEQTAAAEEVVAATMAI
ncbi:hypothetical protein ACA910_012466 [Epithemia clementina (nom. ined.)]